MDEMSLGRRERQIMEIVYRNGQASVKEVLRELPDPPSYSAVRGMLGLLEHKGHLSHRREGLKYIYLPTTDAGEARATALSRLVRTFFGGSVEQAAVALLTLPDTKLPKKDRQRLTELINKARQGGK
jgi:predicted transcriptional regulator